jgi:hypothetical protein
MIEQEQVVQEKKDDVVSEEVKQKNKPDNNVNRKQKIYEASFFFILGFLSSIAPSYLQTNIAWIVNVSEMVSLLCWAGSIYYIYGAYPRLFTYENITMIIGLPCAFFLYVISETVVPKGQNTAHYIAFLFQLRTMSYTFLFLCVMFFMMRLPHFIHFYACHKGKIKTFFTAKHTAGLILSILAVGTALFQFIQVVLQVFHL